MTGTQFSLAVRLEALCLLSAGMKAVEVADRLGVPRQRVWRWARLAGMSVVPGTKSAPLLERDRVSGASSGHGRRLSLADRAVIQVGIGSGMACRSIAAAIGVAPSTVSREVARASVQDRTGRAYRAEIAQQRAQAQRRRPKVRKLEAHRELRAAVVDQLNARLSPQQAAMRLRQLHPGREDMRVSHETIYQALYVQGRGALRHELTVHKALRSGRTGRVPQSKLPRRTNRPWLEGARLSDRPAAATDRAVPGHWEGDLVVGPANSGLVTLVERHSRFALIGRLPGSRDSETVIDRLTEMIRTLPKALFHTLTWDQGQEMAQHAQFTIATGCRVYFADPHSPWQRGSNENLNGLIRDFYPKGTNFNRVTDNDIADMQRLLNIRPRMTLQWATPAEKLDAYISGVALTP